MSGDSIQTIQDNNVTAVIRVVGIESAFLIPSMYVRQSRTSNCVWNLIQSPVSVVLRSNLGNR